MIINVGFLFVQFKARVIFYWILIEYDVYLQFKANVDCDDKDCDERLLWCEANYFSPQSTMLC